MRGSESVVMRVRMYEGGARGKVWEGGCKGD